MTEQLAQRAVLFGNLTRMVHREYDQVVPQMRQALSDDPHFASRALTYIALNSQIRDQADSAIAALISAPAEFYIFRDAGQAMLGSEVYKTVGLNGFNSLPPFRLLRVWEYLHDHAQPRPARRLREVMVKWGSMLEKDPERLDGVIELNRQRFGKMARLYHLLKPGTRVHAIYNNNPPEDSRFYLIKQIARIADGKARALALMDLKDKHNVNVRVVEGMLTKGSPLAEVVKLHYMSPNEVANAAAKLEASGILTDPEAMAVFRDKMNRASSAASLTHRKSSQVQSAEVKEVVRQAADKAATKVDKKKMIDYPLLVLVDISSSMTGSVPTAIEFLSRIVPLVVSPQDNLRIVMFNNMGILVKPRSYTMSAIRSELEMFRASGMTSMSAGLRKGLEGGFTPARVVLITDGGESRGSSFAQDMGILREQHGLDIPVSIIGIRSQYAYNTTFDQSLDRGGIPRDTFPYEIDPKNYYVLDNVAALLGGERPRSIVEIVLDLDLPRFIR